MVEFGADLLGKSDEEEAKKKMESRRAAALHYMKTLKTTYGCYQPEIRFAIDVSIEASSS